MKNLFIAIAVFGMIGAASVNTVAAACKGTIVCGGEEKKGEEKKGDKKSCDKKSSCCSKKGSTTADNTGNTNNPNADNAVTTPAPDKKACSETEKKGGCCSKKTASTTNTPAPSDKKVE